MSAGWRFGCCCGGKSEVGELEQRKRFLMWVFGEEDVLPNPAVSSCWLFEEEEKTSP